MSPAAAPPCEATDEGMLFVTGSSEKAPAAFDSVALIQCGKSRTLYRMPEGSIDGALLSRDQRWLLLVRLGGRHYRGASVPLSLPEIEIVAVELATQRELRIPVQPQDFMVQSIALGWTPPSTLHVRLKDVYNGADDHRLYSQCDLQRPPCELPGKALPRDDTFPRADVLEVTSMTAYLLEPLPQGFARPERLVDRTVHVSRSRRFVSYVTELDAGDKALPPKRQLWIANLASGERTEIARGEGFFHARWRDDDVLVYEAPEEPTPLVKEEGERRLAELVTANDTPFGAGVDLADEKKVAMLRRAAMDGALVRLRREGHALGELLAVDLWSYSPRLKRGEPFGPKWARLWSGLAGPTHHIKGLAREVPAD